MASILQYNGVCIPANSTPAPNSIPMLDGNSALTIKGLITQGLAAAYALLVTAITVTTSGTLGLTAAIIRCNATSGAQTQTLPPAASCTGVLVTIKKIDSSGNLVTVAANSGEFIDGSATNTSLSAQYNTLRLFSNGVGWDIV